ncbi:MAG: nitronate monooxygenase [bacterium]
MKAVVQKIIQGGMGTGVSNWRLAQTVSRIGQLGLVSGTGLDHILIRRLQDGDPEGHMRRALSHFPFPKMVQRILDTYFIPGGKADSATYKSSGFHTVEGNRAPQEMCIAANFVEVFLAREGHSNPVGINYLEKIQLPHLPSIYGAMLAGVSVVVMGAGIPLEVPGILDTLVRHESVSYPVYVAGLKGAESYRMLFNPRDFMEDNLSPDPLERPAFLPIVASDTLATMLLRRATGSIQGFIIEGPLAGGHNAPPRGKLQLSATGEPIYGPRDVVNLEAFRAMNVPFWLAGSCGSAEGLRKALAEGATGIQVGSAFALCEESGMTAAFRRALVQKALDGKAEIFTDPLASPTGFPFKVAKLEGTLSEPAVYAKRQRRCDLGFLREVYRKEDGAIGYRCPAEPVASYVAKGGKAEDTLNRKCLCNGLVADVGYPQSLSNGTHEPPVITLGDDYIHAGQFCSQGKPDYTAADVIRTILG